MLMIKPTKFQKVGVNFLKITQKELYFISSFEVKYSSFLSHKLRLLIDVSESQQV